MVQPEGKILGVFDGFPFIRGEKCHVVRIYFLCKAETTEITLSSDHDAYAWIAPDARNEYHLVSDIEEVIMAYTQLC